MTYSELLQTPEWKSKRIEILLRDEKRCQNCYNYTYQSELSSGLLFNGSNEKTRNGSFVLYISDYKKNDTIKVFLNKDAKFDPIKNYIVFYKKYDDYYIVHAMKLIESKIIFNTKLKPGSYMTFGPDFEVKFNIRKMISEVSFHEIYKNISKQDIWEYIIGLHVHHKYYRENRKPWEYPDEALVTLCWSCHKNLHENDKVPYLDEAGSQIGDLTPCSRCFGAGWFPEYHHIQSGICFRCNGSKYEEFVR